MAGTTDITKDLTKRTAPLLPDKLLVVNSVTGAVQALEITDIRNLLAATFAGSIVPSAIEPGTNLGAPAQPTIYEAPAGSYTTNTGAVVVLTGNLNKWFWDGAEWSYLEVPIDVDLSPLESTISKKADKSLVLFADRSKNLADKSLIKRGNYDLSGVFNNSNHWIHFEFDLTPFEIGDKFALSGLSAIATTVPRFVFFDGLTFKTVINSTGLTTQLFTKIANVTKVMVNIANAIDIADNRTDNVYANAFQIELSEVVTSYQSFYDGLNSAKLNGQIPDKNLLAYAKKVDALSAGYEKKSKNLANKLLMKGGSFTSNGVNVFSSNWIYFEFDLNSLDTLALSGMGVLTIGVVRAVFFNGNTHINGANIMGNGTGTAIITPPALATRMGVNVANAVGYGDNPKTNPIANTFQIEKNNVVTSYESYYIGINGANLVGDIPRPNLPEVDFLISGYTKFTKFDGTAYIPLTDSYILDAEGDYLEFVARTGDGTSFTDWLGMFGDAGDASTFGFYTTSALYLRTFAGEGYRAFSSLPSFSTFRKVKLIVEGGAWRVYVDDVLTATTGAKGHSFLINTVGNSYTNGLGTFSKFDLQSFKIQTAAKSLVVTDPSSYPTAYKTKISYFKSTGASLIELKSMYYSFNPTGYNGATEQVKVYVRRGISNSYVGFEVSRFKDDTELVYSDQFRITAAHEYMLNEVGQMVLIFSDVLVAGESECVWMRQPGLAAEQPDGNGMADHTGGVHGDEKLTDFAFYVNGLPLALTTSIPLTACDSAFYVQNSTMHETAKIMGGVTTIAAGHPIDCFHLKRTDFKNSGYGTYNKLIWARAVPVKYWYHGICCIGKLQASKGFDEENNKGNFTGSNAFLLVKDGVRKVNFYNETNKLSAEVTSTLLKPSASDSGCQLKIWDRATDSKYYRAKDDVVTTAINEVWESTMEVKFN